VIETSFNYSFEISLKPTSLDILENPQLSIEDEIESQDSKVKVNCDVVMKKCLGEMIGILLYTLAVSVFCITSVDTYVFGKPWTCVIEWFICIILG
jgi:hypothetical protein